MDQSIPGKRSLRRLAYATAHVISSDESRSVLSIGYCDGFDMHCIELENSKEWSTCDAPQQPKILGVVSYLNFGFLIVMRYYSCIVSVTIQRDKQDHPLFPVHP